MASLVTVMIAGDSRGIAGTARVIAGIAGIGYSDHLEPDGPRRQVVEGGQLHTDEVPEERQ